jgi:NAD+ kinase
MSAAGDPVRTAGDAVRTAGDPVRTAALLTHSEPGPTTPGARAAGAMAARAGCRLVAERHELERHGEIEGIELVEELPERLDLCLALGGDGTILRGLRRFAASPVPVFGVNYGTVGFLAAAEASAIEPALERALAGDFELIDLPGLSVDSGAGIAVNDVSFIRRPHARVADLSYRLGGSEVGHVRCDGLVAATPVGSTGYNLANGGPILAWGVEGYVVSFIAPHTLTARALVVAPDDVLHVLNDGDRDSVDVALDGVPGGELAPGSEIEVRFRDRIACLAQLEGATFYSRIREKFGHLAH